MSSFFHNSSFKYTDLEPASSASFGICTFGFYTILSNWWENPWAEYLNTNRNGRSLLQLAVIAGCVPIGERLIYWGSKVNLQLQNENYGNTLVAAGAQGQKGVVELLLGSGADVNVLL